MVYVCSGFLLSSPTVLRTTLSAAAMEKKKGRRPLFLHTWLGLIKGRLLLTPPSLDVQRSFWRWRLHASGGGKKKNRSAALCTLKAFVSSYENDFLSHVERSTKEIKDPPPQTHTLLDSCVWWIPLLPLFLPAVIADRSSYGLSCCCWWWWWWTFLYGPLDDLVTQVVLIT